MEEQGRNLLFRIFQTKDSPLPKYSCATGHGACSVKWTEYISFCNVCSNNSILWSSGIMLHPFLSPESSSATNYWQMADNDSGTKFMRDSIKDDDKTCGCAIRSEESVPKMWKVRWSSSSISKISTCGIRPYYFQTCPSGSYGGILEIFIPYRYTVPS